MKKIVFLLVVFFTLSCDDGNIDVPVFNFNDALSVCTNSSDDKNNYVFYKTNENEALSIAINAIDIDILTTETTDDEPLEYALSETGNTITYRTFDATVNGSNYFCQNIPPASPNVTNIWTGEGTLVITTTKVLDDEDGVPSEIEDKNNDGIFTNDNSDDDDIPDYIDRDDDNDGILTKNEDVNGDGDYMNDDTDGDGKPNFRDDDDDGDGTKTIDESADANGDGLNDYLDPNINDIQQAIEVAENVYQKIFTSNFTIFSLNLSNGERSIRYETYDLGQYPLKIPVSGNDEDQPK